MTVAFQTSKSGALPQGDDQLAVRYAERLGARLRELRKQSGLTQRALAERLGVSTPALCRWEKGQTLPRRSNIRAFAHAFDLSEAELLSGLSATPENAPARTFTPSNPPRDVDDRFATRQNFLTELLTACKRRIAEAAGTSPERIRIVIEV